MPHETKMVTPNTEPTHEIIVTARFKLYGKNVLEQIDAIAAIRDVYAPFVAAVHQLGGAINVVGPLAIAAAVPVEPKADKRTKAARDAARAAENVAADIQNELAEAAE